MEPTPAPTAIAAVIDTAYDTNTSVTVTDAASGVSEETQQEIADDGGVIKVVTSTPADTDQTVIETIESTTGLTTYSSSYAKDIKVVAEYSDGTQTELGVTNKTTTITLDKPVASDGSNGYKLKIYHIKSTLSGGYQEITDYTVSGNVVTFTAPSYSTYYVTYEAQNVDSGSISLNVTLSLEPVSGDNSTTNGEYYLMLTADTDKYINRFMSAELAFAFDETGSYEITDIGALSIEPNDYIEIIDCGNGEYEFNVDGKSTYNGEIVSDITGSTITLATVTITGNGTFALNLDVGGTYSTIMTNQVQTAEISNNIVSTFTVNAGTSGNLYYGTNPIASGTVSLAMVDLTINVVFPNAVNNADAAYTNMTVKVTGLGKDGVEYSLGTDGDSGEQSESVIPITYAASGDEDSELSQYYGYQVTVSDVYQNYAYQLEFTGDGYRMYRAAIIPTADASVTVWNNAMAEEMVVVSKTGADSAVYKTTTFLAGEIIADNVINLYDLSAAVSYFGKTDLTSTNTDYIKYDLNRDGKIDSKDIAMVLVSWGK